MKGMNGENLMTMLESRFDSVVFRLGFARTRREARQLVDHKMFLVNGKKVNIPSYLLKAGDVIEVADKKKSLQRFKDIKETTDGRLVPDWLECDNENFKATVKNLALDLVNRAEKSIMGSGQGAKKKKQVFAALRAKCPAIIQWAITDEVLDAVIERAFDAMTAALSTKKA